MGIPLVFFREEKVGAHFVLFYFWRLWGFWDPRLHLEDWHIFMWVPHNFPHSKFVSLSLTHQTYAVVIYGTFLWAVGANENYEMKWMEWNWNLPLLSFPFLFIGGGGWRWALSWNLLTGVHSHGKSFCIVGLTKAFQPSFLHCFSHFLITLFHSIYIHNYHTNKYKTESM